MIYFIMWYLYRKVNGLPPEYVQIGSINFRSFLNFFPKFFWRKIRKDFLLYLYR